MTGCSQTSYYNAFYVVCLWFLISNLYYVTASITLLRYLPPFESSTTVYLPRLLCAIFALVIVPSIEIIAQSPFGKPILL